ncbi:unnamed protein product [Lathyrus oleraceus]
MVQRLSGLKELFIIPKDIKDVIVGKRWLDIGLLQVWCTYIHRVCIELNKLSTYGLLDPVRVRFTTNSTKSIEE